MRKIVTLIAVGIILTGCKNETKSQEEEVNSEIAQSTAEVKAETDSSNIEITPISHATAVFQWDDSVFYTDPVGGAEAFAGMARPDFILITDIHGDHMNAETIMALEPGDTKIIVPKAVKKQLPDALQKNLIVMNNGETIEHAGFSIKAVPMYNLPQTKDAMHVKGRGNGYVLEKNGERLYISGDTEDIPEMRDLKNIDVALVSMNLPYTMPVDQAADGVLAFKPKKVIPYHYRGKDGFSDVEKFKQLVNKGDSNIEVELMEWYPKKG
ncbi:L-ascorbate metabolism protein UlaG (beta-lactamase superfamily) [Christiangramia gaetbulicola]|uniref:L-ascorbate metabolism protein UlaG (Beta-lactamase superfamily) n=1 Tax=Christiangramia gaetbulicola TaxID=703340 RepID=A0A2T6AIN5_9FLAO|nr:MBL fold metallo-hydrolase [Christiangramia gaetbulicola]PTX43685.1 L-ascorbate metabolism protein UlaG (beta-lactamase superfamily) [Christiangramia gaetbulicola]